MSKIITKKTSISIIFILFFITALYFTSASVAFAEVGNWNRDPFGIRSFVNQFGFNNIPEDWDNSAALNFDSATAQKICELAGFTSVISKDCKSQYGKGCGYDSCHDNNMGKWNASTNNFDIINACDAGNKWISSLVCGCSSHASQKCVGNAIYWYDSCNKQQEKVQDCLTNQACSQTTATTAQCKNVECSTNTQCGNTGFVDGTKTCGLNNSVYQDYITYSCNEPGKTSSYCSHIVDNRLVQPCDNGQICYSGQCITTACGNLAYRITNFINNYGYYVSCGDSRYISNFDVNDDKVINASDVFKAQYLMSEIECLSDRLSACCTANASQKCGADNKIYQFNSCGVQSNIVTRTCSDSNGYVGNKTCGADGNVHQIYRTYSCSQGQADCSYIERDDVINNCVSDGKVCDEATKTCKTITCTTANTAQVCGFEAPTGGLFCGNTSQGQNANAIYQKYNVPACLLQGTVSSSCTTNTRDDLKTTCANGCSAGACIPTLDVALNSDKDSALTDETITFTASAIGGFGNYTYTWYGASCQTGTPTNICRTSYSTIGDKEIIVYAFSGIQQDIATKTVRVNTRCIDNYSQKCGTDNKIYQFNSCGVQSNIVTRTCSDSNGFVDGTKNCVSNNVYQTYNTYTCGQGQTTCTATPENRIVNDCLRDGKVCDEATKTCQNVACTLSNVATNCGTNGFFGVKSCSTNKTQVLQQFKTWSCLNAGSTLASCSDAIDPARVFETCNSGFACDAGECKRVNCSTEAQCGADGYVGDLSCKNGDVWQDYRDYTCHRPGEVGSYCVDTTTSKLKTDCTSDQTCDETTKTCELVACTTLNALSKCGSETPQGALFCGNASSGQNSNGIYQKYSIPYCNLPGTTGSACLSRQEDRLQNTCAGFCQSGQCYENLNVGLYSEKSIYLTDETITFTATAVGGVGNYIYSWVGASCRAGTALNICETSYSTIGNKEVIVYVYSGTKQAYVSKIVRIDTRCTNNYSQKCVTDANGTISVYNYNSCGVKGTKVNDCTGKTICQESGLIATCAPIACRTSHPEDCNPTTFGNLYCKTGTNSVFQDKTTYTCQNADSINSVCQPSLIPEFKTDCNPNKTCINGSCECTASAFQKCGTDNKIYQFDSCGVQSSIVTRTCSDSNGFVGNKTCGIDNNVHQTYRTYACSQGQTDCSYTERDEITNCVSDSKVCDQTTKTCQSVIACSKNRDCGDTETPVGGLFCGSVASDLDPNAIYQKYTVPVCKEKGLPSSYCDTKTEDRLQNTCSTSCSNGACVVVTIPDVSVRLVVNPNPAKTNQVVLFSATDVSGGNGIYAYSWTGICSNIGNFSTCTRSNLDVGSYPVSVTVSSGGKTKTADINLVVNPNCSGASPKCGADGKIHNYDSCDFDLGIVDDCSTRNYTGVRTCVDGNARQTNIVGSCSTGQTTCTTTTTNPIVETCNAETQTCFNGACVNKTIACVSDSACGTNGEIGERYCRDGDVRIDYKTWDCVNENTPASRCEYSIAPRLVTDCTSDQTCTGQTCVNEVINCTSDSICGTNGYIGDASCQSGDVWRNYRTYDCINENTPNSRCSDSSAPRLVTDCTANQTCIGQACVDNPADFTVTASASPNPATTTQQVTFSPTTISSDSTKTYTYIWTGDCVGIGQTCQKTFTQPGSYTAIVTVTSGSQTKIASASVNVGTSVTTPSVQTNSATSITTNSAVLNGNITSLGGASSASVWFKWGTTSSYGYETSRQTLSSLASFNQSAVGLAPNTTYHYQAVIQNSTGIAYGQDVAFTTTTITPTATNPTANAGPDQYVNAGQNVTLQGSGYDPNGQALTYLWSCNNGYLSNPNSAQPTFVAPNVNSNTNYYCSLTVRNTAGLTATDDMIVRINYINNNIVTNSVQTNSATNITTNSATLNGYLYNSQSNNNNNYNNSYNNNYGYNTSGVWFQYGLYTSYGSETNHQNLGYAGSFSQYVSGLQQNTLYHFRAVSQDNSGQISYGQDMTFTATGNQGLITVLKTVRNLSSGTNWANSVSAKPGDILSFMVVASVTGTSQNINNVTIRDILPANLINRTNITVDNIVSYGDLNSGINVGYLSPSQMRTMTYQVQVAPSSNFSFGNTTLTNYAYVTSSELIGSSAQASATVLVNKSGVLGATSVSTGLTNNIWLDSFFLPALLAIMGIWGYKSGIFGIDEWIARRKNKTKDFRAGKILNSKITEIKNSEINTQKSSWPTL
jgi:hypothetical protein